MSRNMTDERELFAPIASITAAPPAVEQEAEPKKKPLPRPDKTDHYYLMVNGEMANIYDAAVDAVKGLKDQAMHKQDDVYLRDSDGERMASKTLVEIVDYEPTSAVSNPTPQLNSVLDLGDDIRHDLAAEGFDPDRANQIEQQIEEKNSAPIEQTAKTAIEEKINVQKPHSWQEALDVDARSKLPTEANQAPSTEEHNKHSNWREALGVAATGGGFQAVIEPVPSIDAASHPTNWRAELGLQAANDSSKPNHEFWASVSALKQQFDAEQNTTAAPDGGQVQTTVSHGQQAHDTNEPDIN